MPRLWGFTTVLQVVTYSIGCSQSIEGTLIIAAKCNDGILLCSDTRVTCGDARGSIFYVDGMKKIFKHGRNLVAIEGRPMTRDTFLNVFISQVDSAIQSPIKLLLTIVSHLKRSSSGIEHDSLVRGTTILTVGYLSDTATISCTETNWIDGKVSISAAVLGPYSNLGFVQSLEKLPYMLAVVKIDSIYKSVSAENKRVGYEPVIWLIDSHSMIPTCIKNCEQNSLSTTLDFYSGIVFERLEAVPIAPYDKIDILGHIINALKNLKISP